MEKEIDTSDKTEPITVKEPKHGLITNYIVKRTLSEQMEIELKTIKEELIATVAATRLDMLKNNEFFNAIRIVDDNGQALTVVWAHAYTKVAAKSKEIIAKIKEITGKSFSTLFQKKAKIEITLNPEDFDKLITLIDSVKLSGEVLLKTSEWLEPTEQFTKERYKLFSKKENEELDDLVKQNLPRIL